MSRSVIEKLAESFGSKKDADCVLLFVEEENPGRPPSSSNENLPPAASNDNEDQQEVLLGEPLPAHTFVLNRLSDRFSGQIERWRPKKVARSGAATSATGSDRAVLEIRIPLRGQDELPATLAAIKFGYTGKVQAADVSEALLIRRQGGYLQVEGCAEACDAAIRSLMKGPPEESIVAVLQFWHGRALWPDGDLAFGALVELAKAMLLIFFRTTMGLMSNPLLRDAILRLPAEGLLALLESDDFGTDNEASVLLLLAHWMRSNAATVDAPTREKLCRQVRLVQLSRPYLYHVLPALARDHAMHAADPALGWLAIGANEVDFITSYASAGPEERQRLANAAVVQRNVGTATYKMAPRRQCLPSEGLTRPWHITAQALERKLLGLQPGNVRYCGGVFDNNAVGEIAAGFRWAVALSLAGGENATRLCLGCFLPNLLTLPGSQLAGVRKLDAVVPIRARATVDCWTDGVQQVAISCTWEGIRDAPLVGSLAFSAPALPLGAQSAGGGDGDGNRATASPLAAWGRYLHNGKITGTLTLLPPSTSG